MHVSETEKSCCWLYGRALDFTVSWREDEMSEAGRGYGKSHLPDPGGGRGDDDLLHSVLAIEG
jgi:hypothetical protein